MFKWKKFGLVFAPGGRFNWMQKYAQCPTTVDFGEFLRIYFCCRPNRRVDGSYVSYTGFVDYRHGDFKRPIGISRQPVIALGGPGEFDEFGTMAGTVIPYGGRYYLYYCGWARMMSVPYNWAIGLAVSNDGETFKKHGKGPILGATAEEPYLQACPIVRRYGGHWHMWYLSGLRWIETGGHPESVYQIMHATSDDGISWERDGVPLLKALLENECQTSASVFRHGGRYHMIFSYRHGINFRNARRGYRIGYAWSEDLDHWHRNDEKAGLVKSGYGWDAKMVCYPHVFKDQGHVYMLYCGNDFGRQGFGIAEMER